MVSPAVRNGAPRLACLALLLAAPAAGTFGLLAYCGYSLRDFVPGDPNDETLNYLQVQAFATHGFRAGHFGVAEQVAPASFSRFGAHGPAFPVLYGGLARLFGMSYGLAAYLNVGALTLALAAYCWLARPSNGTLLLLAGLVLTYWPFYEFALGWMQDPFHYAVAVLLAGLFAALLGDPPPARRRALFAAAFAAVCLASLVRISWALLLPPLFVIGSGARTARATAAAALAACVAVLACMKAFQMLCAPFSRDFPHTFLMNKLFTGEVTAELLLENVSSNLGAFVNYFRGRFPLQQVVLVQSLLLLAVAGLAAAGLLTARTRGRPSAAGAAWWVGLVAYNQAAIAFATVLLYIFTGGGPRVFSIHLFFGLLVACKAPLRPLRWLVPAVLALNLAAAAAALGFVRDSYAERFTDLGRRARVNAFREKIAGLVTFDPAGSGWDNTLATDRVPPEMVALPPGIGVEYYFSRAFFSRPPRSRYIIALPDCAGLVRGDRLKYVAPVDELGESFIHGPGKPALYRNVEPAP